MHQVFEEAVCYRKPHGVGSRMSLPLQHMLGRGRAQGCCCSLCLHWCPCRRTSRGGGTSTASTEARAAAESSETSTAQTWQLHGATVPFCAAT